MNLNLDADWGRIATILALGTIAWVVTRKLLSRLRITLIAHADDEEEAKRITTLMRAIKQFVSMLLLAVVVMLVLSAIGINIAPLLGAAGVAGVAIGLAGQGIARDFIRGFSLLVDNQIRVGDAVEVAGKSGGVPLPCGVPSGLNSVFSVTLPSGRASDPVIVSAVSKSV